MKLLPLPIVILRKSLRINLTAVNLADSRPAFRRGLRVAAGPLLRLARRYFGGMVTSAMMVFAIPTALHAEIFGNNGTPGASGASIQNAIVGDNYTIGASGGTADSITVYLSDGGGTAGNKLKCAIYLAADTSLVGVTVEQDPGVNGAGWSSLAIDGDVCLEAGTQYFLVAWASFSTQIKAEFDVGFTYWRRTSYTYTGTYPDPGGLVTATGLADANIYCTYTVDACGAECQVIIEPDSCRIIIVNPEEIP